MNYKSLTVILLTLLLTVLMIPVSSRGIDLTEQNDVLKNDVNQYSNYLNVTENSKWQMKASIHGNNIVWEDYRDDPSGTWSSPGNRNSNIYLYNLEEKQTYQLTYNNSSQVNPDIWGNYVVWEDYRNDRADIYYTDITPLFEGEELDIKPLSEDTDDQLKPKIHEGMVVWEDYRENYLGDIYLYDILEDRGPYRLNTRDEGSFVPHTNPDIYENKVVWNDYRNHWQDRLQGDVFLYDLTIDSNDNGTPNYRDPEIEEQDPAEIEIANQSIHQHSPAIYKDTIVWTEYSGKNNNDIYFKKLSGEKTRVSTDEMKDDNPNIYGETIVYQKREYDEDNNPTADSIWAYDIFNDEHELIQKIPVDPDRTSSVKARFPTISQNKIAWEENHPSSDEDIDYQYDIFFTEIENKEPIFISAEVANQTKEYDNSTEMMLVDGNELHFRAEIIDPNADIEEVSLDTGGITSNVERIHLEESEQDIYEGTMEYQEDMEEGLFNVTIEVFDSAGHHVESDHLEIRLTEAPFEFSFTGVGTDMDELGNETRFVLEEGNNLFFVAEFDDFQGEVNRVYVDVSSFELEQTEFELDFQDGFYSYEYDYEEDISSGLKPVRFHAISERGQEIESEELTVDIALKPPEDPKIISYGTGKELSDLKHSIDFDLKDGNYIYFVANVSHVDEVDYDVYLDISDFDLNESKIKMVEKLDENTYYYRFEYSEDMKPGERTAYIYVEDEFGQNETSGEIKVNFTPPEEPLPVYYYIIPIIVIVLLIIGVLYWKKPEYFKRSEKNEY
ncbi:MAG: hypothetical protein ACOC53_07775 [Candidatus Saliniplasma sp.]